MQQGALRHSEGEHQVGVVTTLWSSKQGQVPQDGAKMQCGVAAFRSEAKRRPRLTGVESIGDSSEETVPRAQAMCSNIHDSEQAGLGCGVSAIGSSLLFRLLMDNMVESDGCLGWSETNSGPRLSNVF